MKKNAKKLLTCALILALVIATCLISANADDAAPIAPATQIPAETAAPAEAEEAEAPEAEEAEAEEPEAETEESEATETEAEAPEAEAAAAETADVPSVPADTVLITVGDQQYTAEDVDSMAYMMYSQGYVDTYPDYDAAVESLIEEAVLENALREGGYTDFTDEEEAAFANEAQAMLDTYLDRYVEYYLTEDTEDARAALRAQAEQYYASQGATLDVIMDNLRYRAAMTRMENDLTGGYEPSEEEINAVFQEQGALYRQQYEGNVAMYEFLTQYYGYESWYVPEGYRSMIHILLKVDDDVLQAYADAQAALDEAQSAETVDETAVAAAQTALDEAFDAVIASRQETIDEIYSRLEQGESFQQLIAEYGTDPGMQDEATLAEGYAVHSDSIVFDPAFVAGAFQEGMQQPGDVSQPVVGSYGIHILYYLKDVPGGLILTDDIRSEIAEYLVADKLNTAYNAQYPLWAQQLEITRDTEGIERLKAQAEAILQGIGGDE